MHNSKHTFSGNPGSCLVIYSTKILLYPLLNDNSLYISTKIFFQPFMKDFTLNLENKSILVPLRRNNYSKPYCYLRYQLYKTLNNNLREDGEGGSSRKKPVKETVWRQELYHAIGEGCLNKVQEINEGTEFYLYLRKVILRPPQTFNFKGGY